MQWDKNTEVYVYGAGLKGKLLVEVLKKIECNVCGYLDRQAKIMSKNVLRPDELNESDRKHCIVVCSVANVFEHIQIAEDLSLLGYEYIVYKNFDLKNELFDVLWDYIENESENDIEEFKKIVYSSQIERFSRIYNYRRTKEIYTEVPSKKGYIDIEVPIILLHTMSEERYCQVHKRQDWDRIPYDKNVYYYLYCGELYRLFENGGSKKEWRRFIRCYKRYFSNADVFPVEELDSFFVRHMEQRYQIYKKMNWLFLNKRNFFKESPVLIQWNKEKNLFNVIDGNNRLAFLMVKGMQKVTCRMQKEDYLKWKNEDVYKKFCNCMQVDSIGKEESVLYPDLSDQCNMEYGGYQTTKIQRLMQYLGKKRILENKKKILLLSGNIVLAHCLDKMNTELYILQDERIDFIKYKLLMELFYMKSSVLIESSKIQNTDYDMVYIEILKELRTDEEQNLYKLCQLSKSIIIFEGEHRAVTRLKKKIARQQYMEQSILTYWLSGQMQEILVLIKKDEEHVVPF